MAYLQTSFQTTPNFTYLGIAPEMSKQTLYGIPKRYMQKLDDPVFKKKLPKSTSKRRIIKKQRQKKLNRWLKIQKRIYHILKNNTKL